VIVETRSASKMSIAIVAEDSNVGERARKAGHAVVTRRSKTCVTSLVHALLQFLRTYFLAIAPVSFYDHVISTSLYNIFSRLTESTCPSNMMLSKYRPL